MEILSFISGVLLFIGVWRINHRDRRAFWFWIAGNSISAWLHLMAGPMWLMAARDFGFLYLAILGMKQWSKDAKDNAGKTAA